MVHWAKMGETEMSKKGRRNETKKWKMVKWVGEMRENEMGKSTQSDMVGFVAHVPSEVSGGRKNKKK